MQNWADLTGFVVVHAETDLVHRGSVDPMLIAFHGDDPLFIAHLRPFPQGAYHGPIVELLALAAPMDADRLAVVVAGRAWSSADPIVPVSRDGDLRQPVVVIESADGHARSVPRRASTLLPYTLSDGTVRWDDVLDLGPSRSWIGNAIGVAIRSRRELATTRTQTRAQTRAQAIRCLELGHVLWLPERTRQRLGPLS